MTNVANMQTCDKVCVRQWIPVDADRSSWKINLKSRKDSMHEMNLIVGRSSDTFCFTFYLHDVQDQDRPRIEPNRPAEM